MGKLFHADRLVPVWLEASRHLDARKDHSRTDRNLMLEIAAPEILDSSDLQVFDQVDTALRKYSNGLNVKTVAATIFPVALYKRHGREGMYREYANIMKRAAVRNTWGTYAMRMMAWPTGTGKNINQLETTIVKLDRAAHGGHPYQSAFEVGIVAPDVDAGHCEIADLDLNAVQPACEIATFHAATDGRKISNMPCLSHLSFKLTNRETVDLTAIYRSHHYAARALGNLLGLSQLLGFVAREAQLKVGTLTCISTHAELDLNSWGGATKGGALLNSLPNSRNGTQ
ncbi:hypothetical protein [Burkholderia vietnamiensis]|uniref:hypothetical protein n=1 Tax=Burkholderia vietnamiensis TaxID=60552 RepID=UPI000AB997CA|nr:hypothetical protein [Burkholderia vietnamiensis]